MDDRREFLRRVAKGAAYAAPVVLTLSTPRELRAIVTSGMIMLSNQQAPAGETQGLDAPWTQPSQAMSPWSEPAPWGQPPPDGMSSPPGNEPPDDQ